MRESNKERRKRNTSKSNPITFTVPSIKSEKEASLIKINQNRIIDLSKEDLIKEAINFHLKGNLEEAIKYYKYFINIGYSDERVYCNYGIILKELNKLNEAKFYITKAIELAPNFAQAHSNLGIILMENGQLDEAEKCQRHAIKIMPNFANAYYNLGIILKDRNKLEEAAITIKRAIKIEPNFAPAYSNLAIILKELRKTEDAEIFARKAIKINPNLVEFYINLGIILKDNGKLEEAKLFILKAIQICPSSPEAHTSLGNIFKDLGKLKQAEFYFRKAIDLQPDFAAGFSNLANLLRDIGQYIEAISCYEKAIELNSNFSKAKAGLIGCRALVCDWSHKHTESIWLKKLGIKGKAVGLLDLLYSEDNPLNQLQRSINFYKENYQRKTKSIPLRENKKIHIGYFSSDFRAHPTMYLIASILEMHDKSKFNIFLYSFAPDEDRFTERAKESGCIFRDIKELDNIKAVELARADKLDIAIDLMGYIQLNRMTIFSHRVAPVQINFLGYPASVGANTFDYIIADNIIIPKENEKFYSEKVIRMPDCYQCNDNTKEISAEIIYRKQFNLPEKGFVFSCFNANNKITPKEFNIWMRLLDKVEDSVLWLYQSNKWSMKNLYKEAEKRNINPERLIFAKSLSLPKHLARHKLADLALDTFNYNGHTTTSDAIWAGLPVITKLGKSFASRVSASILTSIGVTELITYNEKEYEDKALELANNKEELLKLKCKIENARNNSNLFNSKLFTQNLEKELTKITLR